MAQMPFFLFFFFYLRRFTHFTFVNKFLFVVQVSLIALSLVVSFAFPVCEMCCPFCTCIYILGVHAKESSRWTDLTVSTRRRPSATWRAMEYMYFTIDPAL